MCLCACPRLFHIFFFAAGFLFGVLVFFTTNTTIIVYCHYMYICMRLLFRLCVWGCCFAYVYGVAVSLIPNKPSFRANKSYDDYVYMCGVAGVRGCGGAGVLLPGLHVGWRRVGLVCLVCAFLSCSFRFEFLFYLEFPVDLSAAGVGQPPLRQPPFAPRVLSLAPPLPPHTLSCTYTLTQ